jgi:hypothetical protein
MIDRPGSNINLSKQTQREDRPVAKTLAVMSVAEDRNSVGRVRGAERNATHRSGLWPRPTML